MISAENNPFSVSKIHKLPYRFKIKDVDAIMENWYYHNNQGLISGGHGAGKSTLLKELVIILEAKHEKIIYVMLNDKRVFGLKDFWNILQLDTKSILVIDGWEQINLIYKTFVYFKIKRLKGFIGTSHVRTMVPVIFEASTDINTFLDLVAQLVSHNNKLSLPDLRILFDKHNGNIRDCFFELYDFVSDCDRENMDTTSSG